MFILEPFIKTNIDDILAFEDFHAAPEIAEGLNLNW